MPYQHPYRVLWQGRIWLVLAIVAFILGPLAPAVAAEEKADEESGWEFQVAPYMWFLSMDGSVTVKGQKSDADLSFSDIWDELNIAGMVEFPGRKDRWGFFGDIIYANLGKDKNAQGIRIVPSVNVLWATAGGFYRLGTWDLADTAKNKPPAVTVDILAGARYTYLGVTLEIEDFPNQKKTSNGWSRSSGPEPYSIFPSAGPYRCRGISEVLVLAPISPGARLGYWATAFPCSVKKTTPGLLRAIGPFPRIIQMARATIGSSGTRLCTGQSWGWLSRFKHHQQRRPSRKPSPLLRKLLYASFAAKGCILDS